MRRVSPRSLTGRLWKTRSPRCRPQHPVQRRSALEKQLQVDETLSGASMTLTGTLAGGDGKFAEYDFYGNPVPPDDAGKIVVPLDGRGFFLRGQRQHWIVRRAAEGDHRFAHRWHRAARQAGPRHALAGRSARLLFPPGTHQRAQSPRRGHAHRRRRRLKGRSPPRNPCTSDGNQTREIRIAVSGQPSESNSYPDEDALRRRRRWEIRLQRRHSCEHDRPSHDHRGWRSVRLERRAPADRDQHRHRRAPRSRSRRGCRLRKFEKGTGAGVATGYLAYDDKNFYFAAKVADSTPDGGTLRFTTRDDDQFFYPEKVQGTEHELQRHQSAPLLDFTLARGRPPLFLSQGRDHSRRLRTGISDNVQIAFNVLDAADKWCFPNPPGTMPGYIGYQDTDYEYALNQVSKTYGGGTEIWRPGGARHAPQTVLPPPTQNPPSTAPSTPASSSSIKAPPRASRNAPSPGASSPPSRKNSTPASQSNSASVSTTTRAATAWSSPKGRSVSKVNCLTFHPDWVEHWSNEVEFGFER